MDLQPLPIGTHTFRKIIQGGYLYIDKTPLIYELLRHPVGAYFLARPRRFGKSLLISTLDEIFRGNRELFQGLWLYDSPYAWTPYPVIRLDFGQNPVTSAVELERMLQTTLQRLARTAQLTLADGNCVAQFNDLIFQMAAHSPVVILVDEYDKPILDNLANLAEAQRIREALKRFYTVIKGMDPYVRFVLLTGVSKFSRVGVFSGLNNLNDLTMDNQYAALLGITQAELETRLQPYLHAFVEAQGGSVSDLQAKIRAWYNGFCFSRQCTPVYNPFSLLLLFQKQEFRNYWFESGTPTFLLELLKARHYPLQNLEQLEIPDLAFSTYEIENLEIVPLLFQTGYLTIKAYEDQLQTYRLSYPNYEVKRAFMTYLLHTYSEVELAFAGSTLKQLARALLEPAWPRFFDVLNVFLASIPYDLQLKQEKYYQTIFYLIFKLIGLEINAEVHTSRGRIDAVIETGSAVYLFEFKVDGRAAEALQQIQDREYFAPYRLTDKTLYLLGANFDLTTRGVGEWTVKEK